VRIVAPSRERRLFTLEGNETPMEGMLYQPAHDAFAAIISAGRYVGPYRLESSLGASAWVAGLDRLTMNAGGSALAYVEETDGGFTVVGASRWGPYHWIAEGPRFDADGKHVAWIINEAGRADALFVDGVEVARAEAGSWDPHDGSPLSLPFADRRSGATGPVTPVITPVLRSGHWQAQIGERMTSPVQWMSDAMSLDGDLVGFLVRDGADVLWREYQAAASDGG
jgi:hypothetical protein